MPLYVGLFNFTDEGVRQAKDAAVRTQEIVHKLEDQGFTVYGVYFTLGAYDLVSIMEAPSEDAEVLAVLALNKTGFVRTTTLRAFTLERFAELADQI